VERRHGVQLGDCLLLQQSVDRGYERSCLSSSCPMVCMRCDCISRRQGFPPGGVGSMCTAVTGYRVERCQGSDRSGFSQIATVTAPHTRMADLPLARDRVRAVDAIPNFSAYSSIAIATTLIGWRLGVAEHACSCEHQRGVSPGDAWPCNQVERGKYGQRDLERSRPKARNIVSLGISADTAADLLCRPS
jgi:hypothetical protein